MKTKMHYLSLIVGLIILVIVGFQNCAKVAATDMTESPSQVLNTPSNFSSAVVGTSDLADLKMLFVIDNSYTMKQNNINLALSFPTLFNSQNSDNLARFAVTSGLITVAQRTPDASLTDQNRLSQLASWEVQPSAAGLAQLPSLRQGDSLGKVAGDSIGYSISNQAGSYTFEPALVLGVKTDGQVGGEISKSKADTPATMIQEFKNRLTLLQSVPIVNYEKNADILDRESGLCALARTLRSPSSFLKAGDLPVIGIFTDEDDSDVDGKKCLASYTYTEGADNLIDGVCETHKSTFNYQISTPKPAQCQVSYQDSFNWSISFETKTPVSTVKYYPITGNSCPQTQFDFQSVTQWLRKKTGVIVSYKTFKIYDGVKVFDPNLLTKTLSFNGTKTDAECQAAAQASINAASEQWVSNSCTSTQSVDASCTFSDSTCVIGAQKANTVLNPGDSTGNCVAQAKSIDGNSISTSVSCHLTGAQVNYPYYLTGCTRIVSNTTTTANGIAKDLSVQANCNSEAQAWGGSVSASTPAVCTTTWNSVSNPRTGTLALGSYPSVTATGACPADVKNQAAAATGVAVSAITDCQVTSLHTSSSQINLTAADCTAQANSFCSSQPQLRNCQLTSTIPASTTKVAQALAANEDLSCTSKCQDSVTGFCKPTATLATVDPSLTVADYLIQAYGSVSACSLSGPAPSGTVSTYNARLESQKNTLCPAVTAAGLPIYNHITKAAYHTKGFAPDYVAGNVTATDGSLQPKSDLPTYILQRSQELFGKQMPIVNVFVRTATDPTGDSGSRGLAYERLATMMNGKVQSVLSPDYSSALQDLSTIISSQISRSFKVPKMGPTDKVVNVKITAKGSTVSRSLASNEWSQSGQTVQIATGVSLNLGDQLEFEFK